MARKRAKRAKSSHVPTEVLKPASAPTIIRTRKVRKGDLKYMLDMPMDVLQEIFMWCFPRDLLNLSRTSRAFHQLLLRRSAACCWKQALQRLEGLPPCPKELIEPAWVRFLYSRSTCTECGSTDHEAMTLWPAVTLDLWPAVTLWPFLMRLCSSCSPRFVIDNCTFPSIVRKYHLPKDIFTEMRVVYGSLWFRSEVEEVLDGWRRLKGSELDIPGWEAFVQERSERVKTLQAFQRSCVQWVKAEDAREQPILVERYRCIMSKLEDAGWGPELQYLERVRKSYALEHHELVKVAKPLTERRWRTVYKGLVAFMEELRAERLPYDAWGRITSRWDTLSEVGSILIKEYLKDRVEMHVYGLTPDDLAQMPEFKEIIYVPEDIELDGDTLRALQPKMDDIIKGWVSQKRGQLREMVLSKRELPDDVDPLELATTFFTCKKPKCSQECLFISDVLAHRCQRPKIVLYSPEDLIKRYGKPTRSVVHEGTPLTFSLREYKSSEAACHIVRLCDKDPQRTTIEEMDALDPWLVYAECSIMNWRIAIKKQTCFNHDISEWRMADEGETVGEKRIEIDWRDYHRRAYGRIRFELDPCEVWKSLKTQSPDEP